MVEAVRTGWPSPRFLLALIAGLPQGAWTRAVLADDPDLRGWSREASLLADLYDNVSVNTVSTGWFKKRPKPDLWPFRPGRRVEGRAAAPKSTAGLKAMFEQAMS